MMTGDKPAVLLKQILESVQGTQTMQADMMARLTAIELTLCSLDSRAADILQKHVDATRAAQEELLEKSKQDLQLLKAKVSDLLQ
ncbi:MAG TPA: hypothetical protein VKB79_14610 [Bryobacteraceae bacterium]|nr:hypothetical protein [Bryobacteraceae bacterium]